MLVYLPSGLDRHVVDLFQSASTCLGFVSVDGGKGWKNHGYLLGKHWLRPYGILQVGLRDGLGGETLIQIH